jgi:hypothetical protein
MNALTAMRGNGNTYCGNCVSSLRAPDTCLAGGVHGTCSDDVLCNYDLFLMLALLTRRTNGGSAPTATFLYVSASQNWVKVFFFWVTTHLGIHIKM